MKKHLTKLALTAALGLAITFTLNACEEKGGGNAKLLETITDQSSTRKFEYDKQNRIVKIDDKTITYADNLITVGNRKFAINGKTITADGESFTINGDGYIVIPPGSGCDGCEFFVYKDGNLTADNSGQGIGYEYDNKKSPFSGCTSPKWLMQILLGDVSASKNNVVKSDHENATYTYKYEYDSDGFPVKVTETAQYEESNETKTTRYAYRGEPQTATAPAEQPAEKASGGIKTVKIGSQTWMAENLNIETGNSRCYKDEEANCKKYGRLYDYETAIKACPSGWKLPSKDEWNKLLTAAGGEKTAGKKLKSKSGWANGTDDFGFSALPGGLVEFDGDGGGTFEAIGSQAALWTATAYAESDFEAYGLRISNDDDSVSSSAIQNKGELLSVRCIQN